MSLEFQKEFEFIEKCKKRYEFKINNLLSYISNIGDCNIEDGLVKDNIELGKNILKIHILGGIIDLELGKFGYHIFNKFTREQFDQELIDNKDLVDQIVSGKVLVGGLDNFNEIIIVTLFPPTNQIINDIIN